MTKGELLKLSKKIVGILKYAFRAADQSRSNDLDLKEFEYLLDRLGIRVSHKGAELLFRAMLAQHSKRFLGFYEFKMAFMVNDPLQHIEKPDDLNPARVLRRHIRQYYETVAAEHKANRKKLAEVAWGLFNNDKTKHAKMNIGQFREGIKYLGLTFISSSEAEFLFQKMNRSHTGMMKKEEFMHCVKKDIPVSLGKVVNVKEILYDTFERVLKDYPGLRSQFPMRARNKSIVRREEFEMPIKQPNAEKIEKLKNEPNQSNKIRKGSKPTNKSNDGKNKHEIKEEPENDKKKSLFQRMRYKSM